ncbi:MAG: hypothetical protein KF889_29670 [Alphaproteobacteria bacterium]|nr:hypothetical protein [Alphaproteobacteria bacterium]MCW5743382.1 hypothetical protein [Alphaproteobacteria bacterium]
MTSRYDAYEVAQNLRSVSPDVKGTSAFSMKEDGIQPFIVWTTRLLTSDEMNSLCQKLATAIRREVPERSGGWAARILAGNLPAMIMGDYYVGWAGRADEWHLREGQEREPTDEAAWVALRERLRDLLIALGRREGEHSMDGEFHLADTEGRPYTQTLFIRQPEFLTPELIAAIQNVLSNGYADWVVGIAPAFGPPLEILWKGIDVRVDSVEERWNRREAEKLLGDRLKI